LVRFGARVKLVLEAEGEVSTEGRADSIHCLFVFLVDSGCAELFWVEILGLVDVIAPCFQHESRIVNARISIRLLLPAGALESSDLQCETTGQGEIDAFAQ